MFKTTEMIKIKYFNNEGEWRRYLYGSKGRSNKINLIYQGKISDCNIYLLDINFMDYLILSPILRIPTRKPEIIIYK